MCDKHQLQLDMLSKQKPETYPSLLKLEPVFVWSRQKNLSVLKLVPSLRNKVTDAFKEKLKLYLEEGERRGY